MATVDHDSLTGANLHEPKGAASADADTVYVANGSGSGVWTALEDTYTFTFADVSTADTIYVPIVNAGVVSKVTTVLGGTITLANSLVSVYNSSAALMGIITIAFSGSSSGDVDVLTPSLNNVIAANSYVRIVTDGASTTARPLFISLVISRT